jgi:hypothetical protein
VTSSHPRVQVSVDPEFASALASVDPAPASRSRLIRDLALRGVRAQRDDQRQRTEAVEYLRRVAYGEVEYDPATALAVHAERDADVG